MKYTAAHWGSYQFSLGDADLSPLEDDLSPSRIGKGWVSAARNAKARVLDPVVRKGWLDGDKGADRCNDQFIKVSWDTALELAANELARVRARYGDDAVFGGSYGWSSAGRFHHAQSQMRRFLALSGGFTSSRETYSHAAAEVLFPHILGVNNTAFQDDMTALPLVAEHCDVMVAFGGISGRTGQIASGGTSRHEVSSWMRELRDKGVRVISVSPERGEALGEWWAIRPGTDVALILGLIHEITVAGLENRAFLEAYTSGWADLRAYVLGASDGLPKSAEWAAKICDLPVQSIRALAKDLTQNRSMISMTWGMQRADHGEQPIWAGLALAAVIGQIGQPGTGYAFGYGSISSVGRAARLIPWPSFPKAKNPVRDFIPVARIADMLLHPGQDYAYNGTTRTYPDIRLVWWTGGNPFHHHQDLRRLERAWTNPDTVIVNEHAWTATARRADIVLPATTSLERNDVFVNRRDPTMLYMSAMFDPMGQARNDHDIFAELAERSGVYSAFTQDRSTDQWMQHLWEQSQNVAQDHGFILPDWDLFKEIGRFDVPDAKQQRYAFQDFIKDPNANPVDSESGRITLANKTIEAMNLPDCPGHPTWIEPVEGAPLAKGMYHLISGQPSTRLHGQNDQGAESAGNKIQGREPCVMHPATAKDLGVQTGDVVRLWSTRGACLAGVRTDDGIRVDCISLSTGAWYDPQIVNGEFLEVHGNPNALTIDKGTSLLAQGNIAHTTVVGAEKWSGPLPELTVTAPPVILLDTE